MEESGEKKGLPEAFLIRMRELLGKEYDGFIKSYEAEGPKGLRLNPLKVREGEEKMLAERMGLRKVPWAREGYYYNKESRPGKHSFHEAGVFYIQEPSAMAVAELLDPRPGERVLDLCGAPGGKTTQIGGRLLGRGFLLSNEIHPARAKILSQNVERMGISNGVVTNEDAETLARYFPCFFHKIAVDAPCSGEGMFRKEPETVNQWSPDNIAMCAARQDQILDQAASMLKPGGRMVYSTCTFSPEEDEGSIERFLERHEEFSIEHVEGAKVLDRGRPEWSRTGREDLKETFRIWPHRGEGEGHYIAVLKKSREAQDLSIKKLRHPAYVKDPQIQKAWETFAGETLTEAGLQFLGGDMKDRLVVFGQQLYRIPGDMPDCKGLRVLRPGLHLGTLKKKRLEPAHGLALCLKKEHVKNWESRGGESPELAAYLRGETLTAENEEGSGWVLMCAEDYSIGWAKQVGTTLKNHYPKGLRI